MAAGIDSSGRFYSAKSAFPLINPATVPRSQISLINPEPRTVIHIFLKAIKHQKMNRPSHPCEESEDYSLADCINQGMARQIGCQAFWSNFSGIPVCQDWGRLKKYIKAYENATLYLHGTFDKHGCLDPCTYIEYQVKRFNETFKRQNNFYL